MVLTEPGGLLTLWLDDPAAGPTNMAADELLAEDPSVDEGLAIRLYGWSRPTLSLGAFQRHADAAPLAAASGLPLVRRSSGGGAILHGTDLTYAAAISREHPLAASPQRLYDVLHAAMVDVLQETGFAAELFSAARHGQRPQGESGPDGPLLCFDRRAGGDIVVGPLKVMGSAQRRLAGRVLQHGSLLLERCTACGEATARDGLRELAARVRPLGAAETARTGRRLAAIGPTWAERVAAACGF
jgi:lipoate-protein ligase A